MPLPNDINEVRVEVLGRSVDESTTWTTGGPAGNRNALDPLIVERVITRLLNEFNTDIAGAVETANGVATRFVTVVGDALVTDKADFDSLGGNLIQVAAAGGAGGRFEFTQSVAADTWTIPHALGERVVSVQVVDDAGTTIWGDWEFDTANRCILHFSQPITGTAVIRR